MALHPNRLLHSGARVAGGTSKIVALGTGYLFIAHVLLVNLHEPLILLELVALATDNRLTSL